jgi:hypothetical protein
MRWRRNKAPLLGLRTLQLRSEPWRVDSILVAFTTTPGVKKNEHDVFLPIDPDPTPVPAALICP